MFDFPKNKEQLHERVVAMNQMFPDKFRKPRTSRKRADARDQGLTAFLRTGIACGWITKDDCPSRQRSKRGERRLEAAQLHRQRVAAQRENPFALCRDTAAVGRTLDHLLQSSMDPAAAERVRAASVKRLQELADEH